MYSKLPFPYAVVKFVKDDDTITTVKTQTIQEYFYDINSMVKIMWRNKDYMVQILHLDEWTGCRQFETMYEDSMKAMDDEDQDDMEQPPKKKNINKKCTNLDKEEELDKEKELDEKQLDLKAKGNLIHSIFIQVQIF